MVQKQNRVKRVAVAYLAADGSLVACHGIALMPGENALLAVAADAANYEFAEVLTGRAAELLHIAVTGRFLGEPAERSGGWVARRARECLADGLDDLDFAAAYGAVALFGDFIMPFLGVTKLDVRGRPLMDLTEYSTRVDIPICEEVFNDRVVDGLARGGGVGGSRGD
jgi:hypothetical protein